MDVVTFALKRIEDAIPHYTGRLVNYLENVYDRLTDGLYTSVTVADIRFIERLYMNDRWMDQLYATNTLYKMIENKSGWLDH